MVLSGCMLACASSCLTQHDVDMEIVLDVGEPHVTGGELAGARLPVDSSVMEGMEGM